LVKAVFNAWPRRAQQELSLQPPLDLSDAQISKSESQGS